MNDLTPVDPTGGPPKPGKFARLSRGALQVAGGAVPLAGGVLSAIAGAWSEAEQDRQNQFFQHWLRMLEDELKEKEKTILELMARLDLQDEEIAKRVESKEYQSLVKKRFENGQARRAKRSVNMFAIFLPMRPLHVCRVMTSSVYILTG